MIPILAFQTAANQNWLLMIVPYVLIMVVFYFLMIAPMRKRQKALSQMVDSLKKGDRVVTNGGIYGEIAGVDTDTVILKVADNVRIKLAKSAIAGLEKEGETPK
ncbi:MAG TPA: preprotein translocase subunit YajC [Thermoanaerobaculia bacterium]|nr:preprotein translocase subunit YajC [Thermoanaerobaculia bacterium]